MACRSRPPLLLVLPHALQPELIDVIAHVTLAELDEIVARGELMLPSVQTMVMGLAYLRQRGLLSA